VSKIAFVCLYCVLYHVYHHNYHIKTGSGKPDQTYVVQVGCFINFVVKIVHNRARDLIYKVFSVSKQDKNYLNRDREAMSQSPSEQDIEVNENLAKARDVEMVSSYNKLLQ